MKHPMRSGSVLSFLVFVVILFVPWPDGGGRQRFYAAVLATFRDVNTTAVRVLKRFDAFQADIAGAEAGEYVLPSKVREMAAMLRRHGVKQYQVSDSIASDAWVLQQIVASAWPRRLEKDARGRFFLNGEPIPPACIPVDRLREVSLVYCP